MTQANDQGAAESDAADRPVIVPVRPRPRVLIAPVATSMPADPPKPVPPRQATLGTAVGQQAPQAGRSGMNNLNGSQRPAGSAERVPETPLRTAPPAPPTPPLSATRPHQGPPPFVSGPAEPAAGATPAAPARIYLPQGSPDATDAQPRQHRAHAGPQPPEQPQESIAPEPKRRLAGLAVPHRKPQVAASVPEASVPAAATAKGTLLRESAEPSTPRAHAAPGAKTPPVVKSVRRPASRPGLARVFITHIDPWSVMKQAFLLSLAVAIIILVASGALWFALDSAGVFEALTRTATEVGGDGGGSLGSLLSFSKVMGVALILAGIETILTTALLTLFAFLYNLAVGIGGGLEVTLSEEN
ncbi:MAG: DUF3566 domain-containing protein [Candidatus Nanopelagicales bacterium]